MLPTYKPLNDVDFDEEHKDDEWEPQVRHKSYAKSWTIPLVLIFVFTNIAIIIHFRSEITTPDPTPLDYGTSTQHIFLHYIANSLTDFCILS